MKKDGPEEQVSQADSTPRFDHGPVVVGIGASAGGLSALKHLFELIPADSGLAFVVVVHLSPEHKSHLPDILQPSVRFPVRQVTETMPLEANNVYVIPPNANLSAIDTHLRLSELEGQRRERAPIDHFFRTLAATHDGHSIGVILTGTGSDGTLGLKEIKAKGGVIVVQDPNEAEFDGMPQSAIATGMVDRVLPLAEIPETLLRLTELGSQITLAGAGPEKTDLAPERVFLPKVLAILKTRTDRDFSRYKPATILRRIARRMQLNYIQDVEQYLTTLRDKPEEANALVDDLLITVTSFFRDRAVFEKLEKEIVPRLFEGKGPEQTLRVWSVGCATGEEAYSVAMLLLEEAGKRQAPPGIQVFASDLHKRSLDGAREGLYPGDIETDVRAERLKRFFRKENGGYRIAKEVRSVVVFAPHNLLADPPFSRLDLITCRNLLIYLDRAVQRDVMDLFHYALRADGYLLLGSAENVEASELFRIEDKKLCLYRKLNVPGPEPRLPVFPVTRLRATGEPSFIGENIRGTTPYHVVHEKLLERYAPPSILIGPDNKLVHVSEHGGRYLIHPGGEVTTSVLKLVREELRIELQSQLQLARQRKKLVDSTPMLVRFNGHSAPVVMHIRPAPEPEQDGFVLIIFEEHQPESNDGDNGSAPSQAASESPQESKRAAELESELNAVRQRLQSIIEEHETSQEEMKASNEEMQSTNEELRSTMEELETSKEELQSINEELQTVNQENRHKVEELSQLTGDLQNLLAATEIATLFLDRDLRIMRFTPRLAEVFNIRVTDRGRPISDLTHRLLGYPQLLEDTQTVLDRLIPTSREMTDDRGCWYLARVLPYRSTENRIEGVVITFTDITVQKAAELAIRESEERQVFLLKLNDSLGLLSDPNEIQATAARLLGEQLGVDRAAYAELDPANQIMTVADGWKKPGAASVIGRYRIDDFGTFFTRPLREGGTSVIEDALNDSRVSPDTYAQTWGRIDTRSAIAHALVRNGRFTAAIFVHEKEQRTWTKSEISMVREAGERTWDAVERARAEARLRESQERFHALVMASSYAIYRMNADWSEMRQLNGQGFLPDMDEPSSEWLERYIEPEDRPNVLAAIQRAIQSKSLFELEHRVRRLDGSIAWTYSRATPLLNAQGEIVEWFGAASDVTARKQAEEMRDRFFMVSQDLLATANIETGHWSRVNPAFTALLGWTEQELLAMPFLDLVHPDDLARSQQAIAGLLGGDILRDFEHRVLCKNGTYRWISWQTVADIGERLLYCSGRDLEDRKRAEAIVVESENRLRTVLEGIPQLVWRSRDWGYWTWASPQWLRFTGQTQEESLELGWKRAIHPEDQPRIEQAWKDAQAKGELNVEYRVRRAADNRYLWHRTRSLPVRNEQGKILEWLGTSTDIEDLKQAEAARQQVEENLRLFVKNVHEYALVQTDPAGMISGWNPGAERLFGYRPDQVLGQNFSSLLKPEDAHAGVFQKELAVVAGGQRSEDARWFVREDGSHFWARWISEPVFDETGKFRGIAKIMRDETEREKADASVRHSLVEKEELLKEVHHRVKNNLQVIVSLLNLQTFQIQDPKILEPFQEARNRVLAISSIHELLYRSESFAGISLGEYARHLVPGIVRFYGLEQRVQVQIVGEGATLELERAVPYGMLVNELVSNACKHAFPSPDTGTITIRIQRDGNDVDFVIADSGRGLPEGFDYQKATSLGLKLVHGLVRQLRGVLEIQSNPGTTVKVRFPVSGTESK